MADEYVDVRAYLESKGNVVKSAGPDNCHLACLFCHEDPGKRGRMYVNVSHNPEEAGLFMCHLCGTRGNLRTLQKHYGDSIPLVQDDTHARHQIYAEAAEFYQSCMTPEALGYLKGDKRGLHIDTIDKHQLGWAEGGISLYKHLKSKGFEVKDMVATGLIVKYDDSSPRDFLNEEITIPYHVAGNVVLIRGKKIDGKYRTPPRQDTRLFNSDVTWDAPELVFCEGEFDAMIMEQLGFNAIASPGAKAWQEGWRGYFDDARRVYLLFDNDKAGIDGAEKIKGILGTVKVRDVKLPDEGEAPGDNDVTNWVTKHGATREQFEELFKEAAGGLLVTVDDAYEEWLSLQGVDGFKWGWESLDSSIVPGHLPGQVAVILAKTNTGKTLALLNLFQRAAMVSGQEDSNILFISLEQTRGDWFERARRIWNFYNLNCPPGDVDKETLNFWRTKLMMVDKNRISEEDLIGVIEDYRYRMGRKPDLVAVDYLGYWSAAFKGNGRYEQTTNAIMSLKAVAKDQLIPIVTPHQVNRMAEEGAEIDLSAARDSGAVEETADFVLGLWSEDAKKMLDPAEYTGEMTMKIGKSRHGGKGNRMKFVFGKTSLTIVPIEESDRVRMAKHEMEWAAKKMNWRDGMWRHANGVYDLSVRPPASARG